MTVKFDKTFAHEIEKLKDRRLKNSIVEAVKEIETAETIHEVRNLKKLKGFKSCYRIRIGDYRIGVFTKEKIWRLYVSVIDVIFIDISHKILLK